MLASLMFPLGSSLEEELHGAGAEERAGEEQRKARELTCSSCTGNRFVPLLDQLEYSCAVCMDCVSGARVHTQTHTPCAAAEQLRLYV
jgi:hypothetical protein